MIYTKPINLYYYNGRVIASSIQTNKPQAMLFADNLCRNFEDSMQTRRRTTTVTRRERIEN